MAETISERIEAYAKALLEVARAEGMLGEVEDDLFRFARVFEGNDDLRMALTDPGLPTERRQAVVEELMGGKALNVSAALASFGRTSSRPSSAGSWSWPRRNVSTRWPRSAVRCRSTRVSAPVSRPRCHR